MQAKRKYKDSVFRYMFNDKKRLQHLYKALSGRTIPLANITINTLKGVFFNDIKNDLSFMAGNRMVILLDHQSSWNPNMPLRMLWYLAKLYQKMVEQAIRQAIQYCESHDLMKEYFLQNEREVYDMVSFKWDDKKALEVAKEDGEQIAIKRIVLSLLKKGKLSVADIADSAGISVEEVEKIAKDNKLAF